MGTVFYAKIYPRTERPVRNNMTVACYGSAVPGQAGD